MAERVQSGTGCSRINLGLQPKLIQGRRQAPGKATSMFRVKICGITRIEDVQQAVAAGADAIGLNFYAPSPRSVSLTAARDLVSAIPTGVSRVGVFVNSSATEMCDYYQQLQLDYLQLHGDESVEMAVELFSKLPKLRMIRAVRCRVEEVEQVASWVREATERGAPPSGLLVDAVQSGQYGGTGQRADAAVVAALRACGLNQPLILAGGLNPENVALAIAAAHPDAVDTASGVEQSPGVKDAAKMRRFVQNANQALPRQEI
jgi:phosphoribosylanthranilate isomerase